MSTPPIRVLVNALHAKSGGGVTYLRNLLPRLARDPGIGLVVYLHPSQRDLLDGMPAGLEVHWAECGPGFLEVLVHEQVRLPALARRLGVDVVFSPANFGPLAAGRSVILLGNSLSVGRIEVRLRQRAYWAALRVATMASCLRSTRMIAVSATAAEELVPRFGHGRERVAVIHHGVSDLFRPPPPAEARGDFLLAVGDLYIQKNLTTLLQAIALLASGHRDLRVRIAGRPVDQSYAGTLADLRAKLGLERQVEFLGHVGPADLATLYRTCRGFVFPSLVETFGMPLVEAMASGAPVACARASAMPEIAGDAALYFDPRDPGDIARALQALADDAPLRAALAARGLERAAHFSWDRCAHETAAVLREAASAS